MFKKCTVSYLSFIAHYGVALGIGIPFGVLFFTLVVLGRIKIKGYVKAIKLVARGRVVIAANHPSMLETYLVPFMFFPWYLLSLKFFVWSVPDRRLLTPRIRFLFWLGRCATVDRSERIHNKDTLRRLKVILQQRGVILIHPEGGRTFKGQAFLTNGKRRIRKFLSGAPSIARSTDAYILPLWITGTDVVLPPGTSFPHFLKSKIYLSFGEPYLEKQGKRDRAIESVILANAILAS